MKKDKKAAGALLVAKLNACTMYEGSLTTPIAISRDVQQEIDAEIRKAIVHFKKQQKVTD